MLRPAMRTYVGRRGENVYGKVEGGGGWEDGRVVEVWRSAHEVVGVVGLIVDC